jgi:phage FluMu gp28-like protein
MIDSVFKPRPYQRAAISDTARYQAWMWSRQTGKGFTVALKVNANILETEGAGQAVDWMIVSRSLVASRQLARKIVGIGKAMCRALHVLEPSIAELKENQFEITYPGGSRVLVLSSNPDAAVGFTGHVVIDEIDVHKQAAELLGNTFPVTSTKGYMLIITSTPRGRRVMHKIFTDAQKPGSPWSFRKLTIFEAVEQGCDQDPETLRRGILDELKWRQEYLCEFVDDEICWIPWALIVQCASDLASSELPPLESIAGEVYAGWDVARWNDLSVLWVAERVGPQLITRGVVEMKRMPFDRQLEQVGALKRCPKFRRLCVDATGIGEMPAEAARKLLGSVEGVKFTGPVKEHLANGVRRAMEDRSTLIPDSEAVHNDLHSLRRTITGAGNYRFEGEVAGSHADRFWAKALMIEAASTQGGTLDAKDVRTVGGWGEDDEDRELRGRYADLRRRM